MTYWIALFILLLLVFVGELVLFALAATSTRSSATAEMVALVVAVLLTALLVGFAFEKAMS